MGIYLNELIMNNIDINKLTNIIKIAAKKILVPQYKGGLNIKEDGSFITEADLAMQNYLQKELNLQWPEYDFFAEEMSQQDATNFLAKNSSGFWCLDPIDGTSNFAAGLPFFSISLALIKDSKIELGIVYDPIREECFTAIQGVGAWLNNQQLKLSKRDLSLKKSIAMVDLKRLSPELRQRLVLDPPYHSQRSIGSVALDWCWLATGRVQVYLHGKMMLWDYAAGLLIAHEAGCLTLGLDNLPIYQLNLQPRQALGAINKNLYHEWKAYLDK
jgi:myo-inositol-1(or 4)-monophosphatase